MKYYYFRIFFVILVFTQSFDFFSQCPSISAGIDQAICAGETVNLNLSYTPVKATTSYNFSSVSYSPNSFTAGSLALATNVDDIYSGVINIGFCFTFYGNTYTQCVIGSNGLVTFDLAKANAYCSWSLGSTSQIPNTSLQKNSIMGPYHDIDPSVNPASGTSEIKYTTVGTAPCRKFIASWSNTPMYSSSCHSLIDNQQIVLYESTNIIEIYIQNKPLCTSWNGGLAILGIQNSTGTVATVAPGKNCTQWSVSNEGYRFEPAGTELSTVFWTNSTNGDVTSGNSMTVAPTTDQTYTATLQVPTCSGTLTFSDNVNVIVSPGTTPTFNSISPFCAGSTAPALPTSSTNSPAIIGAWSPITIDNTASATYTFIPTAGQCASTTTLSVTVNPIPTVTINSATVCNGTSATLTATPSTAGGTYLWNTGATTASITVTPGTTTTYTCVYTLNGCPSLAGSGTVTVNPIPTVTINSATVCNGTSATLTATPSAAGGTYLWNTGATTASITVTPGTTTTYTCVYTLNGCPSLVGSGTVTVNPIPTVTINSATVCDGTSATLTATPSAAGGTYLWNTGATTASITVTPGTTTTYTCVYTLNGCPSIAGSGTVTVNPIPTVTINSATVCNGTSATLTATPSAAGGTYLWNTGATTASITVTPGTTTTYTCVYTLNGCPSLAGSGTVTVNPIPTVTINSATVCNGTSATLTATPSAAGGTYLWNTGATTASITVTPGSTTTYTCVYTLNGCPSLAGSGTVTVNPIPTVTINSATVCDGTSATLTATPSAAGGTYLWNTGATTASITITPGTTTTYTCVYTLNGCPSLAGSGTVTVNPIPTVTINSVTVCNGTSATLTATPSAAGGTYLWSTGATTTSITVTPGTSTTYTCVYTLNSCPSLAGSGMVTVNPIPTVTVNSTSTCPGSPVTITATPSTGGGTYLWVTGETTASITVSPIIATTYSVVYTLNGCPSLAATGTVSISPNVPINAGVDQTVCENTAVTLTATGGATYTWDNGVTNGVVFTPAVGTVTYTVNGTDANGCTGTDQVDITVNPLPTVSAGANQTVCIGASVTLSGTGAVMYTWNNGITNTASFTPAVGTTYTVTGTDANGCVNTDQVDVIVNPLPTVNAGADQTVCIGTTVTLSITGAAIYTWDNGITDGVGFTPALGTLTYTVTGTDANGCVNTDQVDVTVLNSAPINAGVNQVVCENTAVTLTATGGVTYIWDNGVTNGVAFTPTVGSVTYTVNGTDANGCMGTDQVDITVNPIPTVNAGADQTVCIGASVTLNGTGAGMYTWNNGITNSTAFAPTVGTITYTVTGTDANGCVNTDQVDVIVNPLPTVNAGADQTVCIGSMVTLSGSGAATYTWNNGVTNGVGFTPVLGTLTYSVTGTDANGCVNTDQVDVTVTSLPIVNAGTDQTFCEGASVTLTATGAVSYTWDNGVTNGTSFTPEAGTVTYTVIGTDVNGCVDTDQMNVTINALPMVDGGLDQEVCDGTMITLSGSGAMMYSWDNSISDNVPFFQTENVITYNVTGVDTNGCIDIDQVVVTVNPLPIVSAGQDQIVCEGTSVLLSASGALTYVWTNSVINNTVFTPSIGMLTYSVTGTDVNGCTNSDQVIVDVKAKVIPQFETILPICQGAEAPVLPTQSINISNLTSSPVTGNWDQTVLTSQAGTFTYTFIPNNSECANTTTLSIVINPLPILIVTDPDPVCEPMTINLSDDENTVGSSGGLISYWYDSIGLVSILNPESVMAGTYYVSSLSDMQCKTIQPIHAVIHAKPEASFMVSDENLSSFTPRVKMINLSSGAESYEWIFQNGDISYDEDPEYVFSDSIYGEQYIVLVAKSVEGCTDTTLEVVNIKEELIFYIPNSFTPDGDQFNQIFLPVFTSGYDPYRYSMLIYNRWGEIVFESHDPKVGWDGTYGAERIDVQDGIYSWKIEFNTKEDNKKRLLTGSINLIR